MKKVAAVLLSVAVSCCLLTMIPSPAQAKSPVLSCGLSLVIPSAGQFYNGQSGKGLLVLGVETVGAIVFALGATDLMLSGATGNDSNSGGVAIGTGLMAGGWLYSVIDAPISSVQLNKNRKRRPIGLNLYGDEGRIGLAYTKRF